ncbi:MAG: hypothetical protein ACOH2M_09055 [Cypionkella sp.]
MDQTADCRQKQNHRRVLPAQLRTCRREKLGTTKAQTVDPAQEKVSFAQASEKRKTGMTVPMQPMHWPFPGRIESEQRTAAW